MSYTTYDFPAQKSATRGPVSLAAVFYRVTGLALCVTSAAVTIMAFKWAALQVF